MLVQLSINNYAIIDKLKFLPGQHLNIVTGETGAGKSIILGALSLILGQRADSSVLINKDVKCVVEATFNVAQNDSFLKALKEAELDNEDPCIIRREINSAGKSRAFVNDTPVTLSVLQSLTAQLVDLHQQFDNHNIEADDFQMSVLDALAQNQELKKQYQQQFSVFEHLSDTLVAKKAQQLQWQQEADYRQFLYDELEQANFVPNEIEDAEMQLKQLSAAEKIITVLQQARFVLDEGEQPIAAEIKRQAQQLGGIADLMPLTQSLHERLLSVYAEAKDIASELETLEAKVNVQPEVLAQLEERMSLGLKLLKKHAVQTTNELLDVFAELTEALKASTDLQTNIEALEQQLKLESDLLHKLGLDLRKARMQVKEDLQQQITTMLADVGMPNAVFKIELTNSERPSFNGLDKIQFLLDANKSGQFQPVYKAASGGELSRIALCIKSLIARAIHMPTLIFDEVDTGISGEAARKVAALLTDLGQFHQVVCITHQPQVAAKGETHFYVYKEADESGKINTKLRTLEADEKVLVIAKMIGGEQPSSAAINNAQELIAS